jgi:hypothetical protein
MTFPTRAALERNTWIQSHDAGTRGIKYLAYCLRAFLEAAERDLCPQWPVYSGAPKHLQKGLLNIAVSPLNEKELNNECPRTGSWQRQLWSRRP